VTNSSCNSILQEFIGGGELFELAERALHETGATGVALALKQGSEFVCRAVAGTTVPSLEVRLDAESGITGACIRSGQTAICNDASSDARVNAAACEHLGVASVIAVPIVNGNETVGVLEALSSKRFAFGPVEQVVLEALAGEVRFEPSAAPITVLQFPFAMLAEEQVAVAAELPSFVEEKHHSESEEPAPITVSLEALLPLPRAAVSHPEQTITASSTVAQSENARARRLPVAMSAAFLVMFGLLLLAARTHESIVAAIAPSAANLPLHTPESLHAAVAAAPPVSPMGATKRESLPEQRTNSTRTDAGIKGVEAAARTGDPAAQLRLAAALVQGVGVKKDVVTGYAWYVVASKTGAEDSTNLLPSLSRRLTAQQIAQVRVHVAEMYWKGTGVKQDSIEAYSWLLLAQAAGSRDGVTIEKRFGAHMTSAQIAEAEQRANSWLVEHHLAPVKR
jgi:TPR repeat protein/putative methionine-R-sulfoxide reductase with GAF domain